MTWGGRPARVVAKRLKALRRRGPNWLKPKQSVAGAWAPTHPPPTPYESWLRVNRANARSRVDLNQAYEAARGKTPSFSVILPVYRPVLWMLEAAIQSVLAQTIDAWEICIVEDGGGVEEVQAYLEDLTHRHPRVRLARHSVNRGISEATNTAAALATGDVLVLLDQDDLLDPECLAELALYFSTHPEADLVYSDHDKIDEAGKRCGPEFKPGWSPVLLLSYMYLGHVISVRRSLFESVGGMRKMFDGSQDFDFALRATEQARHIGHVPRILYHWRAIEGSTALSGGAKPDSFRTGAEAVRQAFERRNITAQVMRPPWAVARSIGVYQPEFTAHHPLVGILMPGPGSAATLTRRLRRLSETDYTNFEILMADDGLSSREISIARSILGSQLRLVTVPKGASLAERLNRLAEVTRASRIVLLSQEVEVLTSSWLNQMNGYLDLPSVSIIGGRRVENGRVVNAGFVLGSPGGEPGAALADIATDDGGYMQLGLVTRDCRAASSDILMTSIEDFQAVGGLDDAHFADHLAFIDLCLRIAPDGGCVICGEVSVISRSPPPSAEDRIRATTSARRWPTEDSFHNRNLSRQGKLFQPFSIAPKKRTMDPVRTTFVSHNLRNEGAPRTLIDLVLALSRRGRIDADVAAMDDGPLSALCGQANVEVTLLTDAISVEDEIQTFERHFASHRTEVVFANTLRAFPAVLAAARAGLPCVVWQHESEPWQTYFSDLAPDLQDAAYRALQTTYRWTYVAEATRQAWAPVAVGHNTLTIPNALPGPPPSPATAPATRLAAREALGLARDDVMILLPGTVCCRKGQRDAVRALRRLDRKTARSVKLFIVGAHPEADYLQRLTDDIGKLDARSSRRVLVVGPAPTMNLYYAAADICLCTSRIESAPRIILEAMSFRLPIISTPVFGISEMVVSDWNATFYPPENIVLLASAIEKLVRNAVLRTTMGVRGADVLASRADFSDEVSEYEDILLEASLASTATGFGGPPSA